MPYTFKQIAGMSVDQISDLASRGDTYREFCAALKTAAQAAAAPKSNYPEIPDGWVLVPRKITEAMKDRVRDHGGVQAVAYALAAWPDLLAAAPSRQGGGPVAWLLNHPVHGENLSQAPITDGDRSLGWVDTPLYAVPKENNHG